MEPLTTGKLRMCIANAKYMSVIYIYPAEKCNRDDTSRERSQGRPVAITSIPAPAAVDRGK